MSDYVQMVTDLPYRFDTPFRSLVITPAECLESLTGNYLGRGGTAFVLSVHAAIAFKFSIRFSLHAQFDEKMGERRILEDGESDDLVDHNLFARRWREKVMALHEEGVVNVQTEGVVLQELAAKMRIRASSHVLRPYLITAEGIFMPRYNDNLNDRLHTFITSTPYMSDRGQSHGFIESSGTMPLVKEQNTREIEDQNPFIPVPQRLQLRWIVQLARAIAWLEWAGFQHADLRPHNIMLDRFDNVVLIDFGCATDTGVDVFSAFMFCPWAFGYRRMRPEAWSFGWIAYNILHGTVPWERLGVSEPEALPRLTQLSAFGAIIHDCWHDGFESLADLEVAVEAEYRRKQPLSWQIWDVVQSWLGNFIMILTRPYYQWKSERIYRRLSQDPAPTIDASSLERTAIMVQLMVGTGL